MNEFYNEKPFSYPENEPRSTENEFFGFGWSVKKINDKCFLNYISGELAGRHKEVEISAEDFEQAKLGKLDLDQLCIKYHVS